MIGQQNILFLHTQNIAKHIVQTKYQILDFRKIIIMRKTHRNYNRRCNNIFKKHQEEAQRIFAIAYVSRDTCVLTQELYTYTYTLYFCMVYIYMYNRAKAIALREIPASQSLCRTLHTVFFFFSSLSRISALLPSLARIPRSWKIYSCIGSSSIPPFIGSRSPPRRR